MAGSTKRDTPLPMEPSIDEILAEAKKVGSRRSVTDASNEEANLRAAGRVVTKPNYTYGDVARDTATTAAIPASFLGGPVGALAGGGLALEGIKNFAEHPGWGSGIMAALGALPGISALRGLGKGAKAAEEVIPRAERIFTDADILKGPTHSPGEVLRGGDPEYYNPVHYGEPKVGRPITSPAFERRMYPEPLANSRIQTGTDLAGASRPIDPASGEALAEDMGRFNEGDWDSVLRRAHGQADQIAPGAPDPWRPGDLTAAPIHRADPMPLPDGVYPPTNVHGPLEPTRLNTDQILESIRKGVTRRPIGVGERTEPMWSVPEVAERVHTGGVKFEQPTRSAPNGGGPRSIKLSDGEEQGITALEDLLSRTGSTPGGNGTFKPSLSKDSALAQDMERLLRGGNHRATVERMPAMKALNMPAERDRLIKGGVQHQFVDKGSRLSPKEAFDEADKRKILFGGVGDGARPSERGPASFRGIEAAVDRRASAPRSGKRMNAAPRKK